MNTYRAIFTDQETALEQTATMHTTSVVDGVAEVILDERDNAHQLIYLMTSMSCLSVEKIA